MTTPVLRRDGIEAITDTLLLAVADAQSKLPLRTGASFPAVRQRAHGHVVVWEVQYPSVRGTIVRSLCYNTTLQQWSTGQGDAPPYAASMHDAVEEFTASIRRAPEHAAYLASARRS